MKSHTTPSPVGTFFTLRTKTRVALLIALVAVIVIPFFSSSYASALKARLLTPSRSEDRDRKSASLQPKQAVVSESLSGILAPSNSLAFMPFLGSAGTYEATCSTPKTTFNLGETVCLKISGEPLGVGGRPARRIAWVTPYGSTARSDAVTSDPQIILYAIPAEATQTFTDDGGGAVVADNRGTWRIHTLSGADGSSFGYIDFTVKDPDKAFVDLSIHQSVTVAGSQVESGSGGLFDIYVTNSGPSDATGVLISDTFSDNITFSSAVEAPGGPGIVCTVPTANTFSCTAATMPAGTKSHISFSYTVNGGTPEGTLITNDATVASSAAQCAPDTTCELLAEDNTSSASSEVPTNIAPQACTLTCPDNISVLATSPSGAVVTFSANGTGDCGGITASHPSGSTFPVGTTLVNVSADNGGSCSFTVTVTEGTPPTISCPSNITVTAAEGDSSATVNPGQPTTNPSNDVTVVGVRSDDICSEGNDPGCTPVPLTAPYPVGATIITWKVTDANGFSATCGQTITVNEFSNCANDTTPPSITAPPAVTVGVGPDAQSCGVTLTDELGVADASDPCSVTIQVSGVPANNFFPVGTTTITYTATDGAGNSASATQTVTVTDDAPPTVTAPADAAYQCASSVPAGSAANATASDNCGNASVAFGETNNGGAGSTASPLVITRTYTATDAAGNTASASQTITVTDDVAPTVTAPADANYQCASGVPAGGAGDANASDNCGTADVAFSETNNGGAGTTASPLIITRTYTATDAAGNTASDSQTITVIDSVAPTVTAPADASYQCASGVPAGSAGDATATDNCGNATIAYGESSNNGAGTTASPLVITRTYTATDAAGNSGNASQTITVIDDTAPAVTAPADASYQCASGVPAGSTADATATDNCGNATIAFSESNNGGAGSTASPLIITRTYTATDDAGNTASDSQTITVIDNVAPAVTAPADASYQCASGVPAGSAADATATDNCGNATIAYSESNNGGAGSTASPLIITRTYTATDAAGNSGSASQTITVIDNTAPTITGPANVTLNTGAGAASCGVTIANLDATLGTATTGDNCGGTVTVARGGVPAGNVFPLGDTFITYTATDNHGNSSAPVTQKVTVLDNTAPTITCPANVIAYLPANSTATSTTVNYPAATAADNCSGSIGITYSKNSGTTFNAGVTTVTATATDAHGNTSSCSFTVTVLYNFTGFFSPVSNVPTLNNVNAGKAIPLKFSLSGNKGLGIMAAGYPASQQITCNSSAPISELEGTDTPGGSTLSYSPDNYHYNWKTENSWAGTCRQLVVKLNDGSEHIALFKFK